VSSLESHKHENNSGNTQSQESNCPTQHGISFTQLPECRHHNHLASNPNPKHERKCRFQTVLIISGPNPARVQYVHSHTVPSALYCVFFKGTSSSASHEYEDASWIKSLPQQGCMGENPL
jgi:hypothetical protein